MRQYQPAGYPRMPGYPDAGGGRVFAQDMVRDPYSGGMTSRNDIYTRYGDDEYQRMMNGYTGREMYFNPPSQGYPQMPGYPGGQGADNGYWPNAARGNPQPGMMYADVLTPKGPQRQQYPGQAGYPNFANDPGFATEPGRGYPQAPGYPGGGQAGGGYWSDASRGNPQPGMMYAQVLTPMGGQGPKQQGGPYMAYGQPAPQPKPAAQPYQRPSVPLAHQVNPLVWDSLGPVGKELAYGAIGATGQDPDQYEYDLNQSRPRGSSLGGAGVRYASGRGGFGGF